MLGVEDSASGEDQKDSEEKEFNDSEQNSRLTSPKETLKPSAQPTFVTSESKSFRLKIFIEDEEYYEKEEIEDVVLDEDS
uniref:Uncharacterized protein n=1 Tax=Strongyloides venezuelensis TaxID=75913 RepID=A0A0K0FX62_STRVS